jgi:predicted RecA/RadA family phage recombinase
MATANIVGGVAGIKTFDHTATADMVAGEITVVNSRVTIAYAQVSSGDDLQLIYAAEQAELPKAAEDLAAGDKVYWDNTAKNVTATATSNTACGMVLKSALTAVSTVDIEFFNDI